MTIPPASITVGKCFVTSGNQVRRVLSVDDGKVTYEARGSKMIKGKWPRRSPVELRRFAADFAREVPCPLRP